jgi:DNA-binding GntR family transcriptional regulator
MAPHWYLAAWIARRPTLESHMRATKLQGLAEKSKSQIEHAYWRLRQDILQGDLKPGEKLRIEHLRDKYQFGASGIREALSRLTSDGLVDSEAQRGFWVAQISREDLRDLTGTRKVIEVEALRQAILFGDVVWEARVVAAKHMLERLETSVAQENEEDVMAWERANRDFHMTLISGCPIRRLVDLAGGLYDQVMRYRHRTTLRRSFPRAGLSSDHIKIVSYTLARDADAACAKLAEHIESIASKAELSIFGKEDPPARASRLRSAERTTSRS